MIFADSLARVTNTICTSTNIGLTMRIRESEFTILSSGHVVLLRTCPTIAIKQASSSINAL